MILTFMKLGPGPTLDPDTDLNDGLSASCFYSVYTYTAAQLQRLKQNVYRWPVAFSCQQKIGQLLMASKQKGACGRAVHATNCN